MYNLYLREKFFYFLNKEGKYIQSEAFTYLRKARQKTYQRNNVHEKDMSKPPSS